MLCVSSCIPIFDCFKTDLVACLYYFLFEILNRSVTYFSKMINLSHLKKKISGHLWCSPYYASLHHLYGIIHLAALLLFNSFHIIDEDDDASVVCWLLVSRSSVVSKPDIGLGPQPTVDASTPWLTGRLLSVWNGCLHMGHNPLEVSVSSHFQMQWRWNAWWHTPTTIFISC